MMFIDSCLIVKCTLILSVPLSTEITVHLTSEISGVEFIVSDQVIFPYLISLVEHQYSCICSLEQHTVHKERLHGLPPGDGCVMFLQWQTCDYCVREFGRSHCVQ